MKHFDWLAYVRVSLKGLKRDENWLQKLVYIRRDVYIYNIYNINEHVKK